MTKLILILNWIELWSAFQELSLETKHGGTEASNPLISHLKLELTLQQQDMIHSVESMHKGEGPSAVLYIPAAPLTPQNVDYIRDQGRSFMEGKPAPDFPGGVGESQFVGRGKVEDIESIEGKQA